MKKLSLLLLPVVILTGCIIRQPATDLGYTYDYSTSIVQSPAPPSPALASAYVPPIAQPVTVYEKVPESLPTPPAYSTIPEPTPRPAARARTAVLTTPPQQTIIRESAGAAPAAQTQAAAQGQFPSSLVVTTPGVGFVGDFGVITNTNGIPTNPVPTNPVPTNPVPTNPVPTPTNQASFTNQPPFSPTPPNTNLVAQTNAGPFAPFTNPVASTVTNLSTNSSSFATPDGTLAARSATNQSSFLTNEAAGAENVNRNLSTNSQSFQGTNSGTVVTNFAQPPTASTQTNGVFEVQRTTNASGQQTFTFTNPPNQQLRPGILESSGAQIQSSNAAPGQTPFVPRSFQQVNPQGTVGGQQNQSAPQLPQGVRAPTGQPEGRPAPRTLPQ